MTRQPLPFADFQANVRFIQTTIRDPPEWITFKLTLLFLTPDEHIRIVKAVDSFDNQIESLGRMIHAYEDGVGEGKRLKVVIDGLVTAMTKVCEVVCPSWKEWKWDANFSAIEAERKPPSPFDAISRSDTQASDENTVVRLTRKGSGKAAKGSKVLSGGKFL